MTENTLKDLEEVWASTTGGTTWVWKKDPTRPGNWVQKMIGGAGGVKMKLTIEEREHNQDLVAWGNEKQCPFRNGLLVRVLPKETDRGQYELTDAELVALIKGGSEEEFTYTVKNTEAEVILRRMLALASADRTVSSGRLDDLRSEIQERYPQGRGSAFYDEIQENEKKLRSMMRI